MKSEAQKRSPIVARAKKRNFRKDASRFKSIKPPSFSLLAEEEKSSEDLIAENSLVTKEAVPQEQMGMEGDQTQQQDSEQESETGALEGPAQEQETAVDLAQTQEAQGKEDFWGL